VKTATSDTLMVSVSGVRGLVGTDLTPELVARYGASFGSLLRESGRPVAVLARDSRTSGPMYLAAAQAGLQSVGCRVIDCGLVPTPTAQLAVEHHHAGGGIVITASHNPVEWNALKFIGADGVFLDQETSERLRAGVARESLPRAAWDVVGSVVSDGQAVARHLERVLALPFVALDKIRSRRFTVALDCVRGAGGTIVPQLLTSLGCRVSAINLETDGRFPHPPEPVPANLGALSELVRSAQADIGLAVDPDVDRLALTDGSGSPIGEDYTLAFAVRAVLAHSPGPVVVNLSTSLVVEDAARLHGGTVERAPVGEANVARSMRRVRAVVGGEGNGGVILPALHLGRDAPLAIVLVLHLMANTGKSVAELVREQPRYVIVKAKAPRGGDTQRMYDGLLRRYPDARVDRQDGLRLAWKDRWLHVRPSGTEPIVRLIAEAPSAEIADELIAVARAAFGD
jgi:phosphomannomutase